MSVAIELHDDEALEAALAWQATVAEETMADAGAPTTGVEHERAILALTPGDLAQATRLVRRLAELRKQQVDVNAAAAAEMQRIEWWRSTQHGRLERQAAFLEHLLRGYHACALAANPKAKTISTPYGTLKARNVAAAPKLADAELARRWAFAAGLDEAVEVKVESRLRWAELKARLRVTDDGRVVDAETGEVPAGVEATEEHIEFTVKPEVRG